MRRAVWRLQARTVERAFAGLGSALVLGMLLVSGLLWHHIRQAEDEQQARALDAAARGIAGRIEGRLQERMAALRRMVERWEAAGGPARPIWEADAAGYLRDMPGVIALQWLGPDGRVRWAVPPADDAAPANGSSNADLVREGALRAARDQRRPTLSPPLPLAQGGTGVLIFHPLQARGRADGFLVCAIRIAPLIDSIVQRTPPNGEFALEYDGRTVYRSVPAHAASPAPAFVRRAAVAVGDGRWSVTAWAYPDAAPRPPLSLVVLGAGLGGTLLVAGVLWFWRLALLRAAESGQLAHIVAHTANAVILTDAAGRVIWVNDAFTRITGYTLAEVRGRKPGEVLQGPETDTATVERIRRHLARGESCREEILNYHKNGSIYWLDMAIEPVGFEHGKPTGFMAIESDITARKQAERMKSEFISTVSHELRTPLTAIRGALGLVAGGVAGPLPEQASALLASALRNSERLTELIDDLLDLEKFESGRMEFRLQRQPLAPLVAQALEANAPYAQALGVSLRLMGPVPAAEVRVDGGRLLQVMSNLLSNAAKFSPPGGVVEIRVSLRDGCARTAVTDHGPGIPEAFRPRVFEKFSQADASDSRARGGTGLGLAISKAFLEGMGGSIGFDTDAGAGTTFYFDLPLAPAAP